MTCCSAGRFSPTGEFGYSTWYAVDDGQDWRAAAYERAATRPCLGPRVSAYDHAVQCWAPMFFGQFPQVGESSCKSA